MNSHLGLMSSLPNEMQNSQRLCVTLQVDAPSFSKDEEDPEARGVHQSEEGEHCGPRRRDLHQVAGHRNQH